MAQFQSCVGHRCVCGRPAPQQLKKIVYFWGIQQVELFVIIFPEVANNFMLCAVSCHYLCLEWWSFTCVCPITIIRPKLQMRKMYGTQVEVFPVDTKKIDKWLGLKPALTAGNTPLLGRTWLFVSHHETSCRNLSFFCCQLWGVDLSSDRGFEHRYNVNAG